MPTSDSLKFNVVDSTTTPPVERWVRGVDIAFPTSPTAEGLDKDGNITIDARDATASSVDMGNTAGPGFTLNVNGSAVINNLTVPADASFKGYAYCNSLVAKYIAVSGHGFLFDGTPTGARTITLPDANGTVVLEDGLGNATVTNWIVCNTPLMRGATNTDDMRFNTSGVSGSHAVDIPSKSGTMAVGTPVAAIPDLVVGVATVNDCATAINAMLAAMRGFEQVLP
jgi:hypothetical protein